MMLFINGFFKVWASWRYGIGVSYNVTKNFCRTYGVVLGGKMWNQFNGPFKGF